MSASDGRVEGSKKEPFWMIDDVSDWRIVERLLRTRFGQTYDLLMSSLQTSDPFDIVYEGNPNEYSDVVFEVLVLLSIENADLRLFSAGTIELTLREAISRRFSDEPDAERIANAVALIVQSLVR